MTKNKKITLVLMFLATLESYTSVAGSEVLNATSRRTEGETTQCEMPAVQAKRDPRTMIQYYIRPVISLSNDSSDSINYSDPPEFCTSCVIYSIQDGLMGIRDVQVVRSDPWQPDPKCKVSLIQIQTIIENFQKIISGSVFRAEPFVNLMSTADECQQALQNINSLSAELSDLYEQMKNAQGISPEEYAKLKNTYDQKINELQTQMDFVKKQAEQDAKEAIDKAQREMDAMRKELNETLEELSKQIAKYQQLLLESAALAIKDGNIKQAKSYYDEVQDKNNLAEIISKSYKVEAIDNIIMFSDVLPTIDEKAVVCETLVNNMKNDMNSPMVLLVNSYVNALMNPWHMFNEKLKEASRKLQPGVQNVMNSFGSQIINNQEQTVLRFAREREGILDDYIEDLVKAAWNYAEGQGETEMGASKILDFGEMLYSDDKRQVLWGRQLYNDMKRSDKLSLAPVLRIAHRNFKANGRMSQFFHDLPKPIRRIIAGDTVVMSLFLTRDYDSDRVDVGMGSMFANQDGRDSWWIFETDDGKTFHIKSDPSAYYLYAANDYFAYSSSERRVFVWKHSGQRVGQGEWELRDAGWKDGSFYLWSKAHGEYLNYGEAAWGNLAPFVSRKVFAWRKDGKGPRPAWDIRGSGWFG